MASIEAHVVFASGDPSREVLSPNALWEGADLSAPVVEIPVAVVHEHHRSAGRARDPEMEDRVVHLHRAQRADGDWRRRDDWCPGGRRRSVRVVAGREGQGDGEEQDRRE